MRLIFKIIVAIALVNVGIIPALAGDNRAAPSEPARSNGQIRFAEISVNGRPLSGPNSAAHRRDSRILIPAAAVARALGDTLEFDPARRSISVRRQNGDRAEFLAGEGRVIENGANVLSVSNTGEIIFPPNNDEFLLPIEIAAVFFDASIRFDDIKTVVTVIRGAHAPQDITHVNNRSKADLYQIDYEYGLNRYSSATSQNLVVNASGRIGDGRFRLSSSSSSTSLQKFSIRNTSFNLERPNGQRYIAGDFGTGADLQFLSTNVRGASVIVPAGKMIVTSFAGRSYSGVFLPQTFETDFVEHRYRGLKYDTTILGISASTDIAERDGNDPWYYSAGLMRFSSEGRQGSLGTGAINYSTSRFKIRGDAVLGRFSGHDAYGSAFSRSAVAIDIAGTFQTTDDLAFHGRIAHIGRNFLSPQIGVREPVDLKAAGLTWSPAKWFSTSFNASSMSRPGDPLQNSRYATGAFALTPSSALPRVYVSHTESSSSLNRSAFTILNASKEFSRFRLYLNGTRIKTSNTSSVNGHLGATISLNDSNSIDVSQGIGSGGRFSGLIDWRSTSFLKSKLNFSAGMGYNHQDSRTKLYNKVSASIKLPRQSSLQVNYYHSNNSPTVMLSLRGTLFKKREGEVFLGSHASYMNSYGRVSGRVYQDIDLNGRFDEGVDKPQANVKIRVDGNRYVVTDETGLYSFESVTAGDHKVYLDLLSVRADLTLLSEASLETNLLPGASSTIDFRLVRTGRIAGQVWHDENENGIFDEGESPLADVRVLTSGGRDTLTDADGRFVITDLPPGEHIVLIDEKTLPEKTLSAERSLTIKVIPGRETSNADFKVIPVPAEIKRFPARTN